MPDADDALTPEPSSGEEEAGPASTPPRSDLLPFEQEGEQVTFPVVGIGASAGGLKAFQAFFSALPAQPDMAFVLVQHLSPDHESTLAELIRTRTQMTVTQVTDHPVVEPNQVYVIPPGKHLEIEDGHLQLVPSERERGRPAAVDHFFRTLAEDVGERAVCVVLSGTGSDGSLGLKAVKERGGLTMAQTPDDAEYAGMPRSATDTGLVDVTGTAEELAAKLIGIRDASPSLPAPEADTEGLAEDDHQALQSIFAHLRQRTAHDFSQYKRATILRRLARRLQVTGHKSLPTYAAHLRATPEEVQALLRDFLISVTQFFRDPEAFLRLEQEGIPKLFEGKGPRDQVRVWVAGCATGEEAYTIAMLLCEHCRQLDEPPDVQVFATDIDDDALARAREGHYASVAAADIPPHLLQRYFKVHRDSVEVSPDLRQVVLFAHHNLISDPPFSRLDLVTCRNVLIYLNREIQARVFATFHYALRPEGLLFLGRAEGAETISKGFDALDKSARLYHRVGTSALSRSPLLNYGDGRRGEPPSRPHPADPPREGIVERYRDWTLEQYAPPRLLVDANYDVSHVFGEAGIYLRDREGPVTQNVVDKVVRAFRVDLRSALFRAFSKGESTDTPFQRVTIGGAERVTRLHVGMAGGDAAQDGLAEIVFIEMDPESVSRLGGIIEIGDPERVSDNATVAKLEDELRRTRARLQATVEEGETSTEELKSSNEELQSINEELQSTTEELETSKEELQSTNEELKTVNEELKSKLDELQRINSDLQNLIASTPIATVFLDRELRLKRFTPRAAELFNTIPTDIGRPFEHLTHRLQHDGLDAMARRVLDTLQPVEEEVQSEDGAWYVARFVPYRTTDDRIDGVVLTFADVSELKAARDEAGRRAGQQEAVAALGQAALGGTPLDTLFELACERAADCLNVEYAKVLEHRPDERDLLLRAGVGWHDGLAGTATVPDNAESQAGFTLRASAPVVVPDLAEEARFRAPALLTDHDVRSGISVPIGRGEEAPYGVLGVHSTTPRSFSDVDGQFVRSIANVLASAVRLATNERTIRDQLAEIEAVYGTAPVGLAFMDQDLRYRRINKRLAEINGLPVEQHIGRRGSDLFPLLAQVVEPILERILETGEAVEDLEFRGATLRDPGVERDWLSSYVPDIGPDGTVLGVSVVVRDVTARKQAERELEDALRQLDFVLEGAGVGVWGRDLASGRVTLDARAQALTGFPAEVEMEDAIERLHPEDREATEAAVEQAVESGTLQLDVRIRTGDDDWRWLAARGRVVPERAGGPELTGIVMDVTDQRAAEAKVHRQLAEVESYFDAVPVGIAVLDREGRYIKVNQRLSAITGAGPDALIGRTARDLWPDLVPTNEPYFQRVLQTGVPVLNVEMALPLPAAPDGPVHNWLVSYYPLIEDEEVRGVSVVTQDVTAIRRAQAGLERLTAELETRVSERTVEVRRLATELTYAEQAERKRIGQVLHDDLQQLLYALQVRMEMVGRALSAAGSSTVSLDEANRLIERAVQATRTLTVDLSPPILEGEGFERALHWVAHRMEDAHGLRVIVEGETEVEINPDIQVLLSRIVRELLFNVVKHADTDEVRIRVETDQERVTVTVADQGRGFNVDAAGQGGSGFGLFSSRERLVLIGGDLLVESEPGVGTTVRVVSPVQV